jgi:hypothetical protein
MSPLNHYPKLKYYRTQKNQQYRFNSKLELSANLMHEYVSNHLIMRFLIAENLFDM